jgi:hypothetical protein
MGSQWISGAPDKWKARRMNGSEWIFGAPATWAVVSGALGSELIFGVDTIEARHDHVQRAMTGIEPGNHGRRRPVIPNLRMPRIGLFTS